MKHYVKGLVVLLVLSAMSISGAYATTVGISNGDNTATQSVDSGSAINQAIVSNSGSLTGTALVAGNYFFTDTVTNPAGDKAGITANVVGTAGVTTGSHSWSSMISSTVATYASILTVGSLDGNNGAAIIDNYAYGSNAGGDFAEAYTHAQDNTGGTFANMQNSFVMGGATSTAAFAWAQADSIQGDYAYAITDSNKMVGPFTVAGMEVGDPSGNTAWVTSPSISNYWGYSIMTPNPSVSVIGAGTIYATKTATTSGFADPNAYVITYALSGIKYAVDEITLPYGQISVISLPTSFAFESTAPLTAYAELYGTTVGGPIGTNVYDAYAWANGNKWDKGPDYATQWIGSPLTLGTWTGTANTYYTLKAGSLPFATVTP